MQANLSRNLVELVRRHHEQGAPTALDVLKEAMDQRGEITDDDRRVAAERSGLTLADLDFVCLLHTKRSMFEALLSELGMTEDQAVYLDDTGHMSGVDSLLGLDRAVRDGRIEDGDAVLLLSAGTGYTWAATVVRWGTSRAG